MKNAAMKGGSIAEAGVAPAMATGEGGCKSTPLQQRALKSENDEAAVSKANVRLSVVIPAYEAQNTIERAVSSVQVWEDDSIEILVVNDGSTDSTEQVVRCLAREDGRIRLISQSHAGRSSARNVGVAMALGERIMFLDADDYVFSAGMSDVRTWLDSSYGLVIFPMEMRIPRNSNAQAIEKPAEDDEPSSSAEAPASSLLQAMMQDQFDRISFRPDKYEWNSACARLYEKELMLAMSNSFGSAGGPFPVGLKFSEDMLFNIAYLKQMGSCPVMLAGTLLYCWDLESSHTVRVVKPQDAACLEDFAIAVKELCNARVIHEADGSRLLALETISHVKRASELSIDQLAHAVLSWRETVRDPSIQNSLSFTGHYLDFHGKVYLPAIILLRKSHISLALCYLQVIRCARKLGDR